MALVNNHKKIAIIGAGGFGREVLDMFYTLNQEQNNFEVLGFIVQKQYGEPGTIVNELPILGDFDWLESHKYQVEVTCAVGAPQYRYRLVKQAKEIGVKFTNAIHPSVRLNRWITLGEGVIITAGCLLTTNVLIGNHVHINLACTIGHDVKIMDYVSIAPGVHVSGNVNLGEGCYIGTGANLIEKLNIGEWSVIGAGSTIIRDVPSNSTVVGVPGKVVKTKEGGWHENEN